MILEVAIIPLHVDSAIVHNENIPLSQNSLLEQQSHKMNKYRSVGTFIYDDILDVPFYPALDGASSKNIPSILVVCITLIVKYCTIKNVSSNLAKEIDLFHWLLVSKDEARLIE